MGKYTPLHDYLASIPKSETLVQLSFIEIDNILNAPLPPAANMHRAWWGNGGHDYAHTWLDAGWLVDKVNFKEGLVDFKRKINISPTIFPRAVHKLDDKVPNSKTIILVSCVREKGLFPSPAHALYISPWFKKASQYAIQSGHDWFILSAKYGLVEPDKVIEPYNQTLKMMSKWERQDCAERVMAALRPHIAPGMKIVFFAGQYYRGDLVPQLTRLGCAIEAPLKSMRIGEQMRWFNEHL